MSDELDSEHQGCFDFAQIASYGVYQASKSVQHVLFHAWINCCSFHFYSFHTSSTKAVTCPLFACFLKSNLRQKALASILLSNLYLSIHNTAFCPDLVLTPFFYLHKLLSLIKMFPLRLFIIQISVLGMAVMTANSDWINVWVAQERCWKWAKATCLIEWSDVLRSNTYYSYKQPLRFRSMESCDRTRDSGFQVFLGRNLKLLKLNTLVITISMSITAVCVAKVSTAYEPRLEEPRDGKK